MSYRIPYPDPLVEILLAHIRDTLYRRQYREEREHPEFVDHGGES